MGRSQQLFLVVTSETGTEVRVEVTEKEYSSVLAAIRAKENDEDRDDMGEEIRFYLRYMGVDVNNKAFVLILREKTFGVCLEQHGSSQTDRLTATFVHEMGGRVEVPVDRAGYEKIITHFEKGTRNPIYYGTDANLHSYRVFLGADILLVSATPSEDDGPRKLSRRG